MTEPREQELSSSEVGGPQTAWIRSAGRHVDAQVLRCIARNAVRGSVRATAARAAEPPPPAVTCVTWWIGWKRS